jgi:protein-S-isoprenylcysteine O-methyltransferase Ste14
MLNGRGAMSMKQADNANRRSMAKSCFAVLVLGVVIFALLYGTTTLFTTDTLARWFQRWESWNGTALVLISVLILALVILLAAVLARGFGRQRMERKALILGSRVLYLPAFLSSLFAIGGLSYLMFSAFVGGGLLSALAWLLMRNTTTEPDWRHWIAVGVVGRGAVDRPDNGTWRVAPLLLVAIGLAITILGLVQVFRARREKRLQKDGLYATVRHPQHLGIAIWTFGLALAASTTAGYMTWFTVLYTYILLALWEERRLIQQFGSTYDRYRRSTPFMIPFVNIGLPLPVTRWTKTAALAAYYVVGMALLCLIMVAVGVEIAWHG